MGRWAAVVVVALSVGLGACTSDPESAPLPEPVEIETCDGLIPVGVVYVERMVLALEGLSVDVLTGEAEPPNDVAALIQLGADLDQRAARLGCDIDQLNTTILVSTTELEADDDPVIGLFLDLVRGGVVGELDPPPTTPTTTTLPSDS